MKINHLAKKRKILFPNARIIAQKRKICNRFYPSFVFIFVIFIAQSAIEKREGKLYNSYVNTKGGHLNAECTARNDGNT